MESLLKYYELELGMLRTHQQEFGARYPGVAGALGIVSSNCHDPHIGGELDVVEPEGCRWQHGSPDGCGA